MSFQRLLEETGCQLDSLTIVFAVEPILFRRKLGYQLRSQSNTFEEFVQDMQTYTEDPVIFRKCLLPSTIADNVSNSSRTSSSESLFKALLAIDSLQPEIITYLLERLPEFYDELENDNSSSCTARLILNQLRWLDYITQPEVLTGKLIEIIQITPPIIQHEIITSLPDMVNDSEHKPIVVFLKELMNENSELTVPILDALSNLTLHSESLDDVRETVLERLESAELDDLAVIVKFMLQTATPTTIDTIIYGIRQKLDFRGLGKLQQQQKRQSNKNKRKDTLSSAPEALILESIKLGLQFHKFVCDSWFKSIVALEQKQAYKIIDILVLVILYSMASMKKKVEVVIRKKISQGCITAALIEETITYHADGLSGYWGAILSLSESLLRSCQQDSSISPCAGALYISSFRSTDAYYRQEIIGALVTHIGSGVEVEMNVALGVLLQLVKSDVSNVAVYSVFVKGILDYLDNLNLFQIRTLFDIFSLLALTSRNPDDGSANLWSEIQIVIRKQLSNPRDKYKNIGIIACLSAVKVLGSKELCDQELENGGSSTQRAAHASTNATRHPYLKQATNLLELASRYSKEYPSCIALIYDELAHMFTEENIDERLELWVKENMASDFTEFYVVAAEDAVSFVQDAKRNQYLKLEPEILMNLDSEDDQITIKMYELIYQADVKMKKSIMVPMCSIFNLIQSCEKQINHGSLEDVDALFGCGIMTFNHENLNDLSSDEIEYACDMLFYTINWFRELLNAFMFSTEEDFGRKLIARLRSVLQLEEFLGALMEQVPNYAPLEFHAIAPSAINSFDSSRGTQSIISPTQQQITQDEGSQHPGASSKKKDHKSTATIRFGSLNDLRPYMRAFYVHVLQLFKYNEDFQNENDKLTFEEINYILKDINEKLDMKIVPSPPTFFGHKKKVAVTNESRHPSCNTQLLERIESKTLIQKIVKYLPNIFQVLENLYSEIQSKNIEPGRVEGSEQIVLSISLAFNVLSKILSWPDIQNLDNKDILESIVSAIAERISDEGSKKRPLSHEANIVQAFAYLSNYGDNMPESQTAVLLFRILLRMIEISGVNHDTPVIANLKKSALKVATHIIETQWFDWRDIKKEIPLLIEQFIELSEDRVAIISDIVNNVMPAFEREGSLEDFPLLRSETLVQHYQAIINQTVKAFDLLKDTDGDAEVILVQTAHIVKIFERITNYVKTKEQRVLMGVLLKSGRFFIEQFTKYSIPFFTKIFKSHGHGVLGIFKDFQTSTRTLQIICSHVKVLKEVTISAYVPPLKKALEVVIYQVKMLLTENRIPSSAFFMGALKHRDIRGAEVSSQIPQEMSEEEEDEMEENDKEKEGNEDESPGATSQQSDDQSSSSSRNVVAKQHLTTEKSSSPVKQNKKTDSTTATIKPVKKKGGVDGSSSKKRSAPSSSIAAQQYRTSSVVPTSDEEDEHGENDDQNDTTTKLEKIPKTSNKQKKPRKQKSKRTSMDLEAEGNNDELQQVVEDEVEEVVEFNFMSESDHEDKNEDENMPVIPSSNENSSRETSPSLPASSNRNRKHEREESPSPASKKKRLGLGRPFKK